MKKIQTFIGTSIVSHESNGRLNCIAVHPFSSRPCKPNQSIVVLSISGRPFLVAYRSYPKKLTM